MVRRSLDLLLSYSPRCFNVEYQVRRDDWPSKKIELTHVFFIFFYPFLSTLFRAFDESTQTANFHSPFTWGYDLISRTIYDVLCFNLINEWRKLQFKSTSNHRVFKNFSWQFYLLRQKSARRKSPKQYFSVLLEISTLGRFVNQGQHTTY